MRRRDVLKMSMAAAAVPTMLGSNASAQSSPTTFASDRRFWLRQMERVASPVLEALGRRQLKATMPIESHKGMEESRKHTTHLEAFGRLLSGIAPWLEHGAANGEEGALHQRYVEMTHRAMAAAVDPQSPDWLEFGGDRQTLVDAAFFAVAVLRAPNVLNKQLEPRVRSQLAEALRKTRVLQPAYSNWLLFSAAVEAALAALGEPWDRVRVDYALRQHMNWYVGDGTYGDGPHFHWDFYNSYVVQPFLMAVVDAVGEHDTAWKAMIPQIKERATRYAHVQERLIAPDGTYPILGRSITYRCGAFHLLADVSYRRALAEDNTPEQVRCALAAVIHRTLDAPDTFDSKGWLRIGVHGHQPSLGEPYISTGSLYLCANAFLPLGLPADDRFWSAPDAPWSSQKVWRGDDMSADHAIDGEALTKVSN